MDFLKCISFVMLFFTASVVYSQSDSTKVKIYQKGTASYYSSKFNGRKTSSGEVFNNKKYTAAHRSLPFGTFVRVVNEKNDKSVIVKVNDRFRPSKGHIIDITMAAADEIDIVRAGRGRVRLEIVEVIPETIITEVDTSLFYLKPGEIKPLPFNQVKSLVGIVK